MKRAVVITASDRVTEGIREDTSGIGVGERLEALGFAVQRAVLPDEQAMLTDVLRASAETHDLIVTTGGTGLTPRDVTPQATRDALDYEVPGLAEAMRAAGRRSTPFADLSRGVVGVIGRALVINLPGSPRGAVESLAAIEGVLDHALETLAGPYDHDAPAEGAALDGGAAEATSADEDTASAKATAAQGDAASAPATAADGAEGQGRRA